jgi:acyl-CoA thioester hydrolase
MDWFEFERQTGIGPILAATQARFRKPLTYPDTISVGARIPKLEQDRFTMEYLLVSHQLNAVAAEGTGTIVTFHYGQGKKAPIPEELRQRIEKIEGRSL